jgi:WD40 repeat protein
MKYLYLFMVLLAIGRPIVAQDTTISKAEYNALLMMQQNMAAQNNMLKKDLVFLKKAVWEAQIALQLLQEVKGFSPNQQLLDDTAVTRLLYRIELEEQEAKDPNFYAKTNQSQAKTKEMQLYYSRLVQKIMSAAQTHSNPKIAALLAKEAYVFYMVYPNVYTRAAIYQTLLNAHNRLDSNFNKTTIAGAQPIDFYAGKSNEIYTRYADGKVAVWSGLSPFKPSAKADFLPTYQNSYSVATRYDGSVLTARQNAAKRMQIWQTKNGIDTLLYEEKPSNNKKEAKVTAVSFAPHSDLVVIARGENYFLLDWQAQQVRPLTQAAGRQPQLIWSSDDKYMLFFEPQSQFLQIWDSQSGQRDTAWENKIRQSHEPQKLRITAISASSTHWLIAAHDGTLRYWARQPQAELNVWQLQTPAIDKIQLSPNAAFAALRSEKGKIQLLELPTNDNPSNINIITYNIPAPNNCNLLFSSNSRQLYTIAPKTQEIAIWATDMFDYAKQICNCTQANLDDATWRKYIGSDAPEDAAPYIKMPDNRRRSPSTTCPNTSSTISNNQD